MGTSTSVQAQIIKLFADDPNTLVTIKDLEVRFGVSPTTARQISSVLLEKNIVSEISLNKVKRLMKGDGLDEILSKSRNTFISILSNLANIGKNWMIDNLTHNS